MEETNRNYEADKQMQQSTTDMTDSKQKKIRIPIWLKILCSILCVFPLLFDLLMFLHFLVGLQLVNLRYLTQIIVLLSIIVYCIYSSVESKKKEKAEYQLRANISYALNNLNYIVLDKSEQVLKQIITPTTLIIVTDKRLYITGRIRKAIGSKFVANEIIHLQDIAYIDVKIKSQASILSIEALNGKKYKIKLPTDKSPIAEEIRRLIIKMQGEMRNK